MSSKLLFRTNLSADSIEKMRTFRKKFYELQKSIEEQLGTSPELTITFRRIQEAQFYLNAHICYTDPQAVLEALPE